MSGAEQYLGGGDEGYTAEIIAVVTSDSTEAGSDQRDPEIIEQAETVLDGMRELFLARSAGVIANAVRRTERSEAQALAGEITAWAGPSGPSDADFGDARDRFVKMWFAYRRRSETAGSITSGQLENVWLNYWGHVQTIRAAGFKRASSLATYHDSKKLSDYISGQSPKDRGKIISLADTKLKDPIGRHEQYKTDVARLTGQFAGRSWVNKHLISYVAQGCPSDPVGEIQRRLDALNELPGRYAGVDGFSDRVMERVSQNPGSDPETQINTYLRRRRALRTLLTDTNPDRMLDEVAAVVQAETERTDIAELLTDLRQQFIPGVDYEPILTELALNTRYDNLEALLTTALDYALQLRILVDFVRSNGPAGQHIDPDILRFVTASRIYRTNMRKRYQIAVEMQRERNRAQDRTSRAGHDQDEPPDDSDGSNGQSSPHNGVCNDPIPESPDHPEFPSKHNRSFNTWRLGC